MRYASTLNVVRSMALLIVVLTGFSLSATSSTPEEDINNWKTLGIRRYVCVLNSFPIKAFLSAGNLASGGHKMGNEIEIPVNTEMSFVGLEIHDGKTYVYGFTDPNKDSYSFLVTPESIKAGGLREKGPSTKNDWPSNVLGEDPSSLTSGSEYKTDKPFLIVPLGPNERVTEPYTGPIAEKLQPGCKFIVHGTEKKNRAIWYKVTGYAADHIISGWVISSAFLGSHITKL